jgi:hypothetical protein
VFFNLYLAHEYYFYACSVFVIFALGYVCACLLRKRSKWGKLLWFGTAVSFMLMYATFLLPKQLQEDSPLKAVVKIVRENSGEDDLLLIYGDVWSSAIPYSSRRKAFMNYHFVREDIQKFDAKMEKVEGWEKIRMAVVNENTVPMFPYLRDRLISLGFAEKPDFVEGGYSNYKKHPK